MEESDEELELLLAFQNDERVPESPAPGEKTSTTSEAKENVSPLRRSPPSLSVRETLIEAFGYDSEDDDLPRASSVSMAAFKDVVSGSLQRDESKTSKILANKGPAPNNGVEFDFHSGLRIRDRVISSVSLNSKLCDTRFVRLQAIRNAMVGDTITGSWATIGVVTEKGLPKLSSTGKNFVVWKLASLDTITVSLFLFGDAYTEHWKEPAGSIFAAFNAKVRCDDKRNFNLSVFSSDQLLKIGTSVDYCICKGIRKDGTRCSVVINRRHGEYCQYHTTAMRQKFKSKRTELSGGNLASGFAVNRALPKPKGCSETIIDSKPEKPVKLKTSRDLKKVLSNADKVTTKFQSQGIRFLASLTDANNENLDPKISSKRSNKELNGNAQKRSKKDNICTHQKAGREEFTNSSSPNLIELDLEGNDNDDTMLAQAMNLFLKK